MSQLQERPCQAFMIVSVHSVQRGPSPPGPTAILSIRVPSCCWSGLKLRTKRL